MGVNCPPGNGWFGCPTLYIGNPKLIGNSTSLRIYPWHNRNWSSQPMSKSRITSMTSQLFNTTMEIRNHIFTASFGGMRWFIRKNKNASQKVYVEVMLQKRKNLKKKLTVAVCLDTRFNQPTITEIPTLENVARSFPAAAMKESAEKTTHRNGNHSILPKRLLSWLDGNQINAAGSWKVDMIIGILQSLIQHNGDYPPWN